MIEKAEKNSVRRVFSRKFPQLAAIGVLFLSLFLLAGWAREKNRMKAFGQRLDEAMGRSAGGRLGN